MTSNSRESNQIFAVDESSRTTPVGVKRETRNPSIRILDLKHRSKNKKALMDYLLPWVACMNFASSSCVAFAY